MSQTRRFFETDGSGAVLRKQINGRRDNYRRKLFSNCLSYRRAVIYFPGTTLMDGDIVSIGFFQLAKTVLDYDFGIF
jgi:hypothetical protein